MLHGAARELRPYDETDAFGWRLLQLAARGQYAAEPLMCCAAAAAEGCLLLLTDLRLLCATAEGGRLLWHVPLREARAAHCSYWTAHLRACLLHNTCRAPHCEPHRTYTCTCTCTCTYAYAHPLCYRVPTPCTHQGARRVHRPRARGRGGAAALAGDGRRRGARRRRVASRGVPRRRGAAPTARRAARAAHTRLTHSYTRRGAFLRKVGRGPPGAITVYTGAFTLGHRAATSVNRTHLIDTL